LQVRTHFLLTLETVVFLFHLLSATSKSFFSLSTRPAHAVRLGFFYKKRLYKFTVIIRWKLAFSTLVYFRKNDTFSSRPYLQWKTNRNSHAICRMVAYFQWFERTLTHISRSRQYSSRIYGEERFSKRQMELLQPVALLVFRLQIKLGIEEHASTH